MNTTLTKEQVIAASEEEFMDDSQLEFIRQRLIEMRQSHTPVMTPAEPAEQRCADAIDQAHVEQQWMINLRRRSYQSDLLSDIDKALRRVATGEYGYCEMSGEPIDINRLLANPVSRTTVEEQQRLEIIDAATIRKTPV